MALLVMATAVLSAGSTLAAEETTENRARLAVEGKNIVFFLLDDATAEDVEYMPNVQSLLREQGVTFTRAYSAFPLCCPARASILTGNYPHNHRVLGNVDPLGGFEIFNDPQTFATWINDDYSTALVGKYLNDYADTYRGRRYVPPGWDAWRAPVEPGTYNYLNQTLNIDGALVDFPGEYSSRLYGRLAREFLDDQGAGPEPFMLYLSFVAPHNGIPRDPDDQFKRNPYVEPLYRDTYTGPVTPNDLSYNEADVSDKQSGVQDNPLLTRREVAGASENLVQRREALRSVDDEIAATIAKVASLGELDDTYFILASDNGYIQGQHRISRGKSSAYEPSAHVPLIVRGPGLAPGSEYRGLVGLQDIAPTILTMSKQWRDQREPVMDGRSLLPLVDGTQSTRRAQLLEVTQRDHLSEQQISRPNDPAATGKVTWVLRGLVTPTGWKYVEYRQSGGVEMYNLRADPFEETNRANDPGLSRRQERLDGWLRSLKSCDGLECQ
ncbi:sulfatase [soil metagenome]